MRAITLTDFEEGPALREVPAPEPGANQVLVRIHASSVNGFDQAVASGMLKEMMEYEFPVTVGVDFAGIVERVGHDVSLYVAGDEVFGFIFTPPKLHDGTWADYVVVPEDRFIAPKPTRLSFLEAGALPLAGVAALLSIDALSPSANRPVLVVGASGGVGSFAVQLAAARGAHVIATTTRGDEARLLELGAAEIVDFEQEDLAAAVRARHPDGVHGLIDTVNRGDAFPAVAELVIPGGRVATPLGAADVDELAARDVTATNVMASPEPALIARLAEHADAGELKVTIQRVHPLERALDGLAEFATSKRGKIAISLVES